MKLRGWTILWTALGVAAAGAACVWVLIHFNLLPMQCEIWMDLYTGNLKRHKTCAGLTVTVEPSRNFSSGLAPGSNLATYRDPKGREDWIKVFTTHWDTVQNSATRHSDADIHWWGLSSLGMVAGKINRDPRPGFKYDPPHGYSKQAKKYLLLNCLQIARETRDAELITQYYHFTVETLRPLDRKAYPDDLPDVDAFLEAYEPGPGS